MNNIIKIKNISKKYRNKNGEIDAIKNIDLEINQGEIISLIGPSGCGKSTLLSIIANIDKDFKGTINKDKNIKIAYMLQNDALLPFLTVYENILLSLKIKKCISKDKIDYINYLLKIYNLEEFKNSYPSSLSGGMRQRVALIRTLALKPDILLLDEPFSALDGKFRLLISDDVYQIAKKENITVILVTHNLEEAITLSDKVIVLTKRPSSIKKVINININKPTIYEKRIDTKFNYYFDELWKALDLNE